MNIEKIYNDKELTIKVDDEIDTVTAPEFENEINSEMGNFDSLILDFENLEYISSAGLRVLITTQKKLEPQGIDFIITNMSDGLTEIITISGLDNILNIQ